MTTALRGGGSRLPTCNVARASLPACRGPCSSRWQQHCRWGWQVVSCVIRAPGAAAVRNQCPHAPLLSMACLLRLPCFLGALSCRLGCCLAPLVGPSFGCVAVQLWAVLLLGPKPVPPSLLGSCSSLCHAPTRHEQQGGFKDCASRDPFPVSMDTRPTLQTPPLPASAAGGGVCLSVAACCLCLSAAVDTGC